MPRDENLTFLQDEQASMTIANLFLILSILTLGGLSVDVTRKTHAEIDLQVVADIAAHAAIVSRQTLDENDAKRVAIDLAIANQSEVAKTNAVELDNIVFGKWDEETRSFVPDVDSTEAVKVIASRTAAKDSYLRGMFLHMVGMSGFEVEASTVYVAKTSPCALNGVAAENVIKVSSNNEFLETYCIHSDDQIRMSSNNLFGEDASVTLPDLANLSCPGGCFDGNPGLEEALRRAPARLDVPVLFAETSQKLRTGDPSLLPEGISLDLQTTLDLPGNGLKIEPGTLVEGQVYTLNCHKPNGRLDFGTGTYRNLLIETNCQINFSESTALEAVAIIQDNTSNSAMHAPSGVRLGAVDNCAPTGDTIILTRGGFSVAAQLEAHGSTVVSTADIKFAAKLDGMMGASFISGDSLEITSGSFFGFCEDREIDLGWYEYAMVE